MTARRLIPFEMFTLATRGYAPFVLNLEASLARVGLADRLVVYALDDHVHAELLASGLRSRRVGPDSHPEWSDYGTAGFARTMAFKYTVAGEIIASGRCAWYVDADIVFLKDPTQHLEELVAGAAPDLIVQYEDPPGRLNAGFWLALPTPRTAEFLAAIPPRLDTVDFTCDQKVMNELLSAGGVLTVEKLDAERFACGNQFLEGRVVEEGGLHVNRRVRPFPRDEAFIMHFNFTIGLKQKLRAMQEHGAIMHPSLEALARERGGSAFTQLVRRIFAR